MSRSKHTIHTAPIRQSWLDEAQRGSLIQEHNLKFLRPYQLQAISALQESAKQNNDRYLFEMATGTGKTLISAAVIKLFLKTGNAKRVLFLVDRLELEDQARKNFVRYLKSDFSCVVFKERRDDWRKAEIVVSTVQSLSFNNKYQKIFSPTDFDLVISDEAHRSIGGNSRAVYEYFIGYKLGLTATPRDYLKKIDRQAFFSRDFEKKLFSERTNLMLCKTFMENASKDPISGEIGKSIVFCVSQNHASKITQILNEFADRLYPGKYNSDFAVQVTSNRTEFGTPVISQIAA